jgi:hypothetical protein
MSVAVGVLSCSDAFKMQRNLQEGHFTSLLIQCVFAPELKSKKFATIMHRLLIFKKYITKLFHFVWNGIPL